MILINEYAQAALLFAQDGIDVSNACQFGADPNKRTISGDTLLHQAIDVSVARALIECGADVNARDMSGDTPLHKVSSAQIALLLIRHGADPNATNNLWRTPLHTAKSVLIAEALISHGADQELCDAYGERPFEAHHYLTPVHSFLNRSLAKVLEHRRISEYLINNNQRKQRRM